MKKRGGRFLLILGAGLAVMAFVVVYLLTSRGLPTAADPIEPTVVPMTQIAVVNQDVPAYTMLDASNVTVVDVEATTAPAGTTQSPNAVFGKMTLMPMTQGQPIITNQLTQTGFSNVIEKGKRAFTLAVQERNTFGGTLTENDFVDVIWTHKYEVIQFLPGVDGKPVEYKKELPTTKTLLQDLRVLRVMSLRPPAPPQNNGGQINGEAEQASSTTRALPATAASYAPDAPFQAVLVIAVNDQQAEVLKFANENGTIDLALRSSAPVKGPDGQTMKGPDGKDLIGDHDLEKTTGITDKVLVESYGLLLPDILVK